MSDFILDKDISILLVPMDLFSEEELLSLILRYEVYTSDFFEYVLQLRFHKRRKEILLSRLIFLYILQTNDVNIYYYNSVKKKEEIITNPFYSSSKWDIYLSISHTQEWLMIALSSKYLIGIDIENPLRKTDRLSSFFKNKILLDTANKNTTVLLTLWTIYETMCKLNISKEERKEHIKEILLKIEKEPYSNHNGFIFQQFLFPKYKVFVWKDGILPGPGCIIKKGVEPQKLKYFGVGKLEHPKIQKPCKIKLTRLLTCEKKLEITF